MKTLEIFLHCMYRRERVYIVGLFSYVGRIYSLPPMFYLVNLVITIDSKTGTEHFYIVCRTHEASAGYITSACHVCWEGLSNTL